MTSETDGEGEASPGDSENEECAEKKEATLVVDRERVGGEEGGLRALAHFQERGV